VFIILYIELVEFWQSSAPNAEYIIAIIINLGRVRTLVLFFAVCGPKYIRLCHSLKETLPFLIYDTLLHICSLKTARLQCKFSVLKFHGKGLAKFRTKKYMYIPGYTTWKILLRFPNYSGDISQNKI